MKLLYLALLISSSYCLSIVPEKIVIVVRTPTLKGATIKDTGVEVFWNPVFGSNDDPVLGYKLRLWEPEKKQVFKYEMVNGVGLKLLSVLVDEQRNIFGDPPTRKATFEVDTKDTRAYVGNIKKNVTYEIRVLAYTKNRESALSDAMSVFLQGS